MEKIDAKSLKPVKLYILVKIRPTLGPCISGTKYDRDKLFFLQKEGVNLIWLSHKIGT